MKTFEQFRSEWILNPSKEMIVESEIELAYKKYASEAILFNDYGRIDQVTVDKLLALLDVVGQSEQFYCKKGTCNEEEQCNHCWNIENPPNVV